MSRHDKIAGSFIGTILCLSVLALPSQSFALTDSLDGPEGGREEWHGPGDPEGGDRYAGDLIYFEIDILGRGSVESSDPREPRDGVPSIKVIWFGNSILVITDAGDARKAYPILLSR